eukprot:CAMPEP_0119156116 /NCGR_PEP_ID=MMETSP1310-20130426/52094_1 /TAXON_ID=464262 /ORGANISM="Genus nov. species nov., Strain RCC2339" /LENGTH=94 /DNA_ID=CAMNT_0007148725 /DNA_START=174 /DNA_END=458 /DNA_ORIENTATION=+
MDSFLQAFQCCMPASSPQYIMDTPESSPSNFSSNTFEPPSPFALEQTVPSGVERVPGVATVSGGEDAPGSSRGGDGVFGVGETRSKRDRETETE